MDEQVISHKQFLQEVNGRYLGQVFCNYLKDENFEKLCTVAENFSDFQNVPSKVVKSGPEGFKRGDSKLTLRNTDVFKCGKYAYVVRLNDWTLGRPNCHKYLVYVECGMPAVV
jgi:hypothetical protein